MALCMLTAAFFARCPALDGNHTSRPGHEKSRKAHGDGEGEHGIEIVSFERGHGILVAEHEGNTPSDKTEGSDDLGGWTGW